MQGAPAFLCHSEPLGAAWVSPPKGGECPHGGGALRHGVLGLGRREDSLTRSFISSPQRRWRAHMPEHPVSTQQAQNPSSTFKCWKRIGNDSLHIRKFCWQRAKQIVPFAKAQEDSCAGFFCSALAVLLELLADAGCSPRESNCQENMIGSNDESHFWSVCFFTVFSSMLLPCLLWAGMPLGLL